MKKLMENKWSVLALISCGVLVGLSIWVFKESRMVSYLGDDPKACINCHVMEPQYISWKKGSHRLSATCNDCHVPHENFARKYAFKAMDGAKHAFMFTWRLEPQTIRIGSMGKQVVQNNCKRCHLGLFMNSKSHHVNYLEHESGEERTCWSCHKDTPHGSERSITSGKDGLTPEFGKREFNANWMNKYLKRGNE